MPWQTQSNGYVAYKLQTALGAAESGAGARVLRISGGDGGRLTKASVENNEVRRDGMMIRGRHGTQKTAGTYDTQISLGLMDDILQAVFRGVWSTADTAITQATAGLTSITTQANTITAAAGSWITAGIKVGHVIRLSGHSTVANNSRNLRVTGVTATVLTVAETLTVDAVADTTFTVTIAGRTLINPPAGSLLKKYFTIEEHELDIDGSEIFQDAVFGSLRFSMQPDGIFLCTVGWVGPGRYTTLTGVSAPLFTTPTEPTGVPMSVADATIRLNGTDFVDLTSFDLTFDISPNSPAVVASKYGPDVFTGQMAVSGNITCLRQDLQRAIDFNNENVCSLHCLAVENETEPKDFMSLYVPQFTLGGVDKSAPSKEGGAKTQTIAIPSALVGKDESGGAFDATMARIQISNAT